MSQQTKLKNFIPYPREIVEDHDKGKLTDQEYRLVDLIWKRTNPYNGYYQTNCLGLIKELHLKIEETTMRKRVWDLRNKQYIYFKSHRGQTGSFPIYPIGFMRVSGFIQSLEYLQKETNTTPEPQPARIPTPQSENKSLTQNHNLNRQISGLDQQFSMRRQLSKTTSTYTDNNKYINKESITPKDNGGSGEYGSRDFSRGVSTANFMPHDNEEELCWTIAQELNERDMRFLLSCRKKFGHNFLKQIWEEFQKMPRDKMNNPAGVFNKFINNKAKESGKY